MERNEWKIEGNERKMEGNERKINGNEWKWNENGWKWKENGWKWKENGWKRKENGRYITPFARQQSGAQVGRQRRTSRPLQSSKAEPRWDARGVHHAPCRAASRHLPREIEAQRRGAQVGRQRRTSRPLQSSKAEPRWDARGVHHAPCRAAKRSPGGTPEAYITPLAEQQSGAQVGRQRRTARPLQSSKAEPRWDARDVHHAPLQSSKAEPRWDARGVHHAPCRAAKRSPGGTPEAYTTPLAEQQSGAQVGRQRRTSRSLQSSKAEPRWDARGVHHAPCTAASRAPATRNRSTEARSPGGTPEAYITPLAEQQSGAQVGRQRRTSRSLQSSKSRACHAKSKHRVCVSVCEWVCESESVWVSVWEWVCVCVWVC